jgi:UDP-N-acetylglucosamine acyltransferase
MIVCDARHGKCKEGRKVSILCAILMFSVYHPQCLGMKVHQTALVSPLARLGPDVQVGPYAVIEDHVEIGDGSSIAAHTTVKQYTTLGRGNRVFEHAVLGGEPQDVKFGGESSRLVIGDDNIIREFCTLHRACGEGNQTRVGSNNFLMVGVHIAHNCIVGNENVFANEVALAGHIEVADHVFLSNNVGAHQFVRFGSYAMVGGKSKIVQDVLPFFITDGNPARARGVNSVGLRRAGFSADARRMLKEAYRILFRSSLSTSDALNELLRLQDPNVEQLIRFIRESERGFTRAAKEGKRQNEVRTVTR